jgi:hypothetical protein
MKRNLELWRRHSRFGEGILKSILSVVLGLDVCERDIG